MFHVGTRGPSVKHDATEEGMQRLAKPCTLVYNYVIFVVVAGVFFPRPPGISFSFFEGAIRRRKSLRHALETTHPPFLVAMPE